MQDLGIRVLFMGDNFARLLSGLWVTVRISLISVVLSIILGVLLGMVMTIKNPVTKALTKIYLEFVRIMPHLPIKRALWRLLPLKLFPQFDSFL